MPWTDFGLGFNEEERKRAMKDALVQAGLTIMSRAGKEGFGSFGPGFTNFIAGYRDNIYNMDDQRRIAREKQLEEDYRRERITGEREDRAIRSRDRSEADATREAEIATRREAIEGIADDKVRGELSLRIAQPDFWSVYDKRTAPAKDEKAPEVRNFEDGTTREWDPVSGDWKVLARKPPKEKDGNDGPSLSEAMTASRGEREAKASSEARAAALKRADAEIADIVAKNAKRTKDPFPLPDRVALAKKYEMQELEASRYRSALPPPSAVPPPPVIPPAGPLARDLPSAAAPAAGSPAVAAGKATPEQSAELAKLVGSKVRSLNLPPDVAKKRVEQIMARAREALASGVSAEEILAELR